MSGAKKEVYSTLTDQATDTLINLLDVGVSMEKIMEAFAAIDLAQYSKDADEEVVSSVEKQFYLKLFKRAIKSSIELGVIQMLKMGQTFDGVCSVLSEFKHELGIKNQTDDDVQGELIKIYTFLSNKVLTDFEIIVNSSPTIRVCATRLKESDYSLTYIEDSLWFMNEISEEDQDLITQIFRKA